MPSLLGTDIAVNYEKFTLSQSDAGRELVITVTKTGGVLNADLVKIMNYITTAHGADGEGDSAFTVAAVGLAGTAGTMVTDPDTDILVDNLDDKNAVETVYMRIQGTGDLTVADADMGITGYAVAVVAEFKPAR